MRDDFDLIVHTLPEWLTEIHLYPFSDSHIGSPEMWEYGINQWRADVLTDPFGYAVLVGDLVNNGLKTSKSNTYEEKLRPREQKENLYRFLKPLADENKLLGGTNGNHEWRSLIIGDDCPLYDVFCRLGIEDTYRENMAFMKISFGKRQVDRQYTYAVALGHGGARSKTETFAYSLDGFDAFIHGHTHNPTNEFPLKFVLDPYNNKVKEDTFIDLTCPAITQSGGYGLRSMYKPKAHNRYPVITFYGERNKRSELLWKQI